MAIRSEIPTLLRRNLSYRGDGIDSVDRCLLSAYRDQAERAVRKNYNRAVAKVKIKRGHWEIFCRRGFQIPWFDSPYPVRVKPAEAMGGHFSEDFTDFDYRELPEGFAAIYFKAHRRNPEFGDVKIPETFIVGDCFAPHGLGAITSEVLENPLYTSRILDNLAKNPVGTTAISLAAGAVIGIPVGFLASECLKYYFGLEGAFLYTIPLFGVPAAGLVVHFSSTDRRSWLSDLRDEMVSRRLPEDVNDYRYGSRAEAEILAEDITIREELKKAALFKKWREMEIGDNKKTFLDFSCIFSSFRDWRSNSIRKSGPFCK